MAEFCDLIITLPQTTDWADYCRELAEAEAGAMLNYKTSAVPQRLEPGARVYVVYKGQIRGWMKYVGVQTGPFRCTTTGQEWPEGIYLQRTGKFHYLPQTVLWTGFQGFRYFDRQRIPYAH